MCRPRHSCSSSASPPCAFLFLTQTGVTYEDSLISLRYAENLAGGHGLVYNPGERVFGASTPLYVLLLAAFVRLGLPDPLVVAKGLCGFADGVTALLWARTLRAETGANWASTFFVVAFGLSPLLVQNSVSGMETSFALLALTAAFAADRADRPFALGVSLGLLALVRPDGVIAALVILGLRAQRERRLPWAPAGLAAGIVLPWLLFASLYFGTLVPNSIAAKAAAYNAHRPWIQPNLDYTLTQFAPYHAALDQRLFNAVIFLFLVVGVAEILRHHRRLLALPLFWLAWWGYLVLPRTLLFRWYYPPLTMAAYALAAFGFGTVVRALSVRFAGDCRSAGRLSDHGSSPSPEGATSPSPRHRPKEGMRGDGKPCQVDTTAPRVPSPAMAAAFLVLLFLAACTLPWYARVRDETARVQRMENAVRRPIGLWLARNTPPDALVSLEPIGYIGYYSRRRVLDEVGLVSPQMIPFTRAGGGWFGRAMRHFRPDYVVERPAYLVANQTLYSEIPMFARDEDRAWFAANYEPVSEFAPPHPLPGRLARDYHFVIYRYRGPVRTAKPQQ